MSDTQNQFDRASEAAEFLLKQSGGVRPAIGIILGSGLGAVAELAENPVAVSYHAIPHFPRSTVEGHSGQLLMGSVAGRAVAMMQGRVHGYEGYSPDQVTFPMRVLGRLGIKTCIVTNAAGAINRSLQQGQLVLLSDHINFMGWNPASGSNDPRFGPRFFDMTKAYSPALRELARQTGKQTGVSLREGVYLAVSGPSYETPAEIRAFRALGADLVGMSTVPEVIVARHMGIEVLGLSCVTNMAAGVLDAPLNHAEVMETGTRVQQDLSQLLAGLIPRIG